jgi:mycothiol synthase
VHGAGKPRRDAFFLTPNSCILTPFILEDSPVAETSDTQHPKHTQLRFVRPDLENLPPLEVPEGYTLRNYQPGDEAGWAAVLAASFGAASWTMEKIEREFLHQNPFKPERIFLVENDGQIVGCAAAWSHDLEEGYVHWVGVKPGHQGKRLGRLVTLATLYQFKKEGRKRAILDTDDHRIPACATYLSLGFQPLLNSPEREEMWRKVKLGLGLN